MSHVLVFGHQNPDNDAIMSAVVLAQLLNQVEYLGNEYEACALGPLPAESAKLLAEAGLPAPRLLDAIEPAEEGADSQQVVLTDHNEPGQSVAGLGNAQVIGVVDHHRFGGLHHRRPASHRCASLGIELLDRCEALRGARPEADGHPGKASAFGHDDRHPHAQEPPPPPTSTVPPPPSSASSWASTRSSSAWRSSSPRPSGSFTPEQMVGNDIKLFEVAGTKLLIGQYETVDKSPRARYDPRDSRGHARLSGREGC